MRGAPLSRQPPDHGSSTRSAVPVPPSRRAAVAQAASGSAEPLRPVVGWPDPIERVDARRAIADDRLSDQPAQEPQVRDESEDRGVVEGRRQPCQGLVAVGAPRDDLREHRVEAAADLGAHVDAGVDPDPVADRPAERLDAAGRRQEPILGILRIQADLDRMAGRPHVALLETERFTGRDPELVGDQVSPGDELGHGMLHLEPGVHLHEGRLASFVDEELARAGVHVSDRARERERRLAQALAQVGVDRR